MTEVERLLIMHLYMKGIVEGGFLFALSLAQVKIFMLAAIKVRKGSVAIFANILTK